MAIFYLTRMYLAGCCRLVKTGYCLYIIHTPSVLCITARQHRAIRGEWGNRPPPFSALGILQSRLLNVLCQCQSIQSEEVTESVFYTISYPAASTFPKISSLMFCRNTAYKYLYLRTSIPLAVSSCFSFPFPD